MRKAITAVLTCEDQIFVITRCNSLTAFPGYTAFPGGTVDAQDYHQSEALKEIAPDLAGALIRELSEELQFDLPKNIEDQNVISISHLGVAITPSFNPYRFETHFVHIALKRSIPFVLEKHEIHKGEWVSASVVLKEYYDNLRVCVHPTRSVLEAFASPVRPVKLNFARDTQFNEEVPYIESLYGVIQFLPLSNTFPPANRTNSFLIGDSKKVLIDPSPKDQDEYKRFVKVLSKFEVNEIFLTHHHPDHHEYAPELAKLLNVDISLSEKTHELITQRWGKDYFKEIKVRFLKEGDVLTRSNNCDIVLCHIPGHDEGQMAPARADHRYIIVGDLIQSVGTVVIGAPEGDMAKYFHSLERMIKLKPKFIVPSHGIALGGVQKLEMTLKHRKQREDQIINLLKQNKNHEEILNIVYEGLEDNLIKYARKTIEAHILKIKQEKLI